MQDSCSAALDSRGCCTWSSPIELEFHQPRGHDWIFDGRAQLIHSVAFKFTTRDAAVHPVVHSILLHAGQEPESPTSLWPDVRRYHSSSAATSNSAAAPHTDPESTCTSACRHARRCFAIGSGCGRAHDHGRVAPVLQVCMPERNGIELAIAIYVSNAVGSCAVRTRERYAVSSCVVAEYDSESRSRELLSRDPSYPAK